MRKGRDMKQTHSEGRGGVAECIPKVHRALVLGELRGGSQRAQYLNSVISNE